MTQEHEVGTPCYIRGGIWQICRRCKIVKCIPSFKDICSTCDEELRRETVEPNSVWS